MLLRRDSGLELANGGEVLFGRAEAAAAAAADTVHSIAVSLMTLPDCTVVFFC